MKVFQMYFVEHKSLFFYFYFPGTELGMGLNLGQDWDNFRTGTIAFLRYCKEIQARISLNSHIEYIYSNYKGNF